MKRAVFILFFTTACGKLDPHMPGAGESLFPLALGNRWTYVVRESDGDVKTKVQTITATTADGAFIMETATGNDSTISTQRANGTQLLREYEESRELDVVLDRVRFVPPSLRVDLQETRLGATYDATFTEEHLDAAGNVITRTPKQNHFAIEAVDELIQVPAGEFRAVRIRRDTEGGAAKTYWYVRGVGKIREVGGQIEEMSNWEGVSP
jgi:hypothetical protein